MDRSWLTSANWEALTTPGGVPMYCLDDRASAFPEASGGAMPPADCSRPDRHAPQDHHPDGASRHNRANVA
jgi:hypothetical protein